MKKLLLCVLTGVTSISAGVVDSIKDMPHVQYNTPLFRASQGVGVGAHVGALFAELRGLRKEERLNALEKNYTEMQQRHELGELDKAAWLEAQKLYAAQKHQLERSAYKSEMLADGLNALGEAAGVRNNLLERGLNVGALGIGLGARTAKRGHALLLRSFLVVLDGMLSVTRSVWNHSPQQMKWMTAAQRTTRLLRNVLRHGVRGVKARVWASYALQLISVGASFVGQIRENKVDSVDDNGRLVYEGEQVFDNNGKPTDGFVDKRVPSCRDRYYSADSLLDAQKEIAQDPTISRMRRRQVDAEIARGKEQPFIDFSCTQPKLSNVLGTVAAGDEKYQSKTIGGRRYFPALAYGPGEEPNWALLDRPGLTDSDREIVINRHRRLWDRQQGLDESDVAATLGFAGPYLTDYGLSAGNTHGAPYIATKYRREPEAEVPVEPDWEALKTNNDLNYDIDAMQEAWHQAHQNFEAAAQQLRIVNGQLQDGNRQIFEPEQTGGRWFLTRLKEPGVVFTSIDISTASEAEIPRIKALFRRHQGASDSQPYFDDAGEYRNAEGTFVDIPIGADLAELNRLAENIVTVGGYQAAKKAINELQEDQENAALQAERKARIAREQEEATARAKQDAVANSLAYYVDGLGKVRTVADDNKVEDVSCLISSGDVVSDYEVVEKFRGHATRIDAHGHSAQSSAAQALFSKWLNKHGEAAQKHYAVTQGLSFYATPYQRGAQQQVKNISTDEALPGGIWNPATLGVWQPDDRGALHNSLAYSYLHNVCSIRVEMDLRARSEKQLQEAFNAGSALYFDANGTLRRTRDGQITTQLDLSTHDDAGASAAMLTLPADGGGDDVRRAEEERLKKEEEAWRHRATVAHLRTAFRALPNTARRNRRGEWNPTSVKQQALSTVRPLLERVGIVEPLPLYNSLMIPA